jgi:hypothetical protein
MYATCLLRRGTLLPHWALTDRHRLFYHPDFDRRYRNFTDSVFLMVILIMFGNHDDESFQPKKRAFIKKESRTFTAGRELHPAPKRFLWVFAAKITYFYSGHPFG